jgi:hypothetical protein
MSAHEHATSESQRLCEFLIQRVQQHLGTNTEIRKRERICGIGHPRFANISHCAEGLTVYLKCQEADEPKLRAMLGDSGPSVIKRDAKSGKDWEEDYPLRVLITSEEDIEKATPLLIYVANKIAPATLV